MPQLILLQRHGEVENLTSNYVVLLGAYRGCYILNWIYRAATEKAYHFIWLMFIAGMVQTALYVDFFYYYAIRYVFDASAVCCMFPTDPSWNGLFPCVFAACSLANTMARR